MDKNDLTKNLKYSMHTDYLKKYNTGETPENIDEYNTWYIDVE